VEDSFHARLARELDDQPEPPLGDLITGALRQGKRLRLVRRVKIAASTVAVAGLVTAGVIVGGQALAGSTGHVLPAASGGTNLTIAPTSEPPIEQPAGPKSPATPAAIVYRLTQLLPAGTTSGYGRASDGELFGQIYLDRGHGPGMVRLTISADGQDDQGGCAPTPKCTTPRNGTVTVTRIPDNCIQSLLVSVAHANGVVVEVLVSTCLAWNGKTNPPGPEALTEQEAEQIAADPSWGTSMSSSLVATAARDFPHLATFS
jgi:hypothetical protein